MITRRGFLKSSAGFSIFGMLSPRSVFSLDSLAAGPANLDGSRTDAPLRVLDDLGRTISIAVPGRNDLRPLPFWESFSGDPLPQRAHQVIPNKTLYLGPGGQPPPPEEFVDLAVVGGGLAGLTAAHQLRGHRPVILDHADHFGGNSRGEVWNESAYSIGGAYFIETCPGTPLDDLVKELQLHDAIRPFVGDDAIELGGRFVSRFWDGSAGPPEEAAAYAKYAEMMAFYAKKKYPELPTEDGKVNEIVLALDTHCLKDEIQSWLGGRVPALLAAAIPAYCYSSFNAGWQEISAAAGINFLAAEEYPLWVMPGGLGQMSHRLWQRIRAAGSAENLRTNCLVFDTRLHDRGVQITYMDAKDRVRSLVARVAVIACHKKFARFLIDDLEPKRRAAMESLRFRSYIVANVLLDCPLPDTFYDLFLLRDGDFPMTESSIEASHPVIDVLHARWSMGGGRTNSVLTLYWPLPFRSAGLHYIFGAWGVDAEQRFREKAAGQVHEILGILRIKPADVRQVRLTRWGHAMPISEVGFYRAGTPQILREPIDERIYFIHQDNWALPALETSMNDALWQVPRIKRALAG